MALRALSLRTRRTPRPSNRNRLSPGSRSRRVLARAPGMEVTAIFSPEHGVNGSLETATIADSRDAATGIPVYSVYGETSAQRHPPLGILKSVDAIVYDIQDVGTRFYTYETTLGYFLEAAAKTGKRIFVLDRPNPINGIDVQGPISDKGREDFTDFGQIPVRHGMTIGELARLYNSERGIDSRLTVIAMEGWQRGDWLDSTGVLWVNPSPNMRSLTEAALYPGIGMLEATNISVGRGTDTPFEVLGAPWIRSGGAGRVAEWEADRRGALCAGRIHAAGRRLRAEKMRRREHHRHRQKRAGRAGTRHRDRVRAARAVSGSVRDEKPGPADAEPGERRGDRRRTRIRGGSGWTGSTSWRRSKRSGPSTCLY